MHSLTSLTAVAALLAVGAAAPTAQGKGFSVEQVVKNPGFILSGPAANARTFMKFNKKMPAHISLAAQSSPGTVPANPEQFDSEYLCPVTLGGYTLNLDFDTGSSDT